MKYVKTKNLEYISTSHLVGLKKIIESQGKNSLIPQIAIGLLRKEEKVTLHKHKTLIEYYYFLKGKGEFIIENQIFYCESGDFVKVKNDSNHRITAFEDLEFLYFGVNTNKDE